MSFSPLRRVPGPLLGVDLHGHPGRTSPTTRSIHARMPTQNPRAAVGGASSRGAMGMSPGAAVRCQTYSDK